MRLIARERKLNSLASGNYVAGGAHLLSESLTKSYEENNTPLANVVKHVMPTGFSAQGRSL